MGPDAPVAQVVCDAVDDIEDDEDVREDELTVELVADVTDEVEAVEDARPEAAVEEDADDVEDVCDPTCNGVLVSLAPCPARRLPAAMRTTTITAREDAPATRVLRLGVIVLSRLYDSKGGAATI